MIKFNLRNHEGDTSYEVFGTSDEKVRAVATQYDLFDKPSFESLQRVLDAEDVDINTKLWFVFTAGVESGLSGGYLPLGND